MAVTLKDIADLAGVSESTVSRVLNNSPLISEKTRQSVLAAARRMNYPQAKTSGWPGHMIGVVQPNITNPLYGEITSAIESRAYEAGYSIILCDSYFDVEREQGHLELLLRQGVSGIILIPIDPGTEHIRSLIEQNIPCVILTTEAIPGADQVNVDVAMGAYLATRHLLELGHRDIALIGGPVQVAACRARLRGYCRALEEYHIEFDPEKMVEGNLGENGGAEAVIKLFPLVLKKQISAIFAINDAMAIGALSRLRQAGITVPGDVSLIGCDDIPVAAQLQPALTTVWQPKRELGLLSTKLILKQIGTRQERGENWRERYPFQSAMYLPHVVARDSTCPPKV
jgi:DNA-binding LacI/PurR family transcriptional regulator